MFLILVLNSVLLLCLSVEVLSLLFSKKRGLSRSQELVANPLVERPLKDCFLYCRCPVAPCYPSCGQEGPDLWSSRERKKRLPAKPVRLCNTPLISCS